MHRAPLIITGMHRSGTSATARLLHQAGVDMGPRLLAPALENRLGYYEDVDFGALNIDLIDAGLRGLSDVDPAWAFAHRLDPARLAPLRPRAAALVAARQSTDRPWGFKDPRVAVLMEFYEQVVPDAVYLFVYRSPWEVVSSLLRSRDRALTGRAEEMLDAWAAHNERVLDFVAAHPGRARLVHVGAVAAAPEKVVMLASELLGADAAARIDATAALDAFDPRLMAGPVADGAVEELLRGGHPRAARLYERLEAAAHLPAPAAPAARPVVTHLPGTRDVDIDAAVLAAAGQSAAEFARVLGVCLPGAASPSAAADASIAELHTPEVLVVFDEAPSAGVVREALTALQHDPGLDVVLIGHDADGGPLEQCDPLDRPMPGAAVVLRRSRWLALGGFTVVTSVAGYEAWSLSVAAAAAGGRVATLRTAAGTPAAQAPAVDPQAARKLVLDQAPGLASARLETLEQRARELEAAVTTARGERDRALAEVHRMRSTRAWRMAVRWWRTRGLLSR